MFSVEATACVASRSSKQCGSNQSSLPQRTQCDRDSGDLQAAAQDKVDAVKAVRPRRAQCNRDSGDLRAAAQDKVDAVKAVPPQREPCNRDSGDWQATAHVSVDERQQTGRQDWYAQDCHAEIVKKHHSRPADRDKRVQPEHPQEDQRQGPQLRFSRAALPPRVGSGRASPKSAGAPRSAKPSIEASSPQVAEAASCIAAKNALSNCKQQSGRRGIRSSTFVKQISSRCHTWSAQIQRTPAPSSSVLGEKQSCLEKSKRTSTMTMSSVNQYKLRCLPRPETSQRMRSSS